MKFICTCLLLLISVLPSFAVDLVLKEKTGVGSNQVYLRDLLTAADADRLETFSGPIRLFRAPEPGLTRKVSRETLARLVGRQVPSDQIHLIGAEIVTISRQGIWIEPEEMEAVLSEFLQSAGKKLPGVELSFKKINLPAHFLVASGTVQHQVIPSDPKIIGSRHLTLITRVDGRVVSNQSIRVEINARAQVVVVTSERRRGDPLRATDLVMQSQEISRLDEPFFSVESLIGKKLKQSVRLGAPLERRQVEFPPVIKRGERVTIRANNRGLLLTASGEARQDGELGDSIRVRNESSQREVLCRVLSPGLVSVEF